MKKPVKRHTVFQPLDSDYRLIPLTKKQNAIVDTADFESLNRWNWCALWRHSTGSFYAVGRPNDSKKIISMQTFILGNLADHKNHNTLDNRRENLRPCTRSQNQYNLRMRKDNTSGFNGVCW